MRIAVVFLTVAAIAVSGCGSSSSSLANSTRPRPAVYHMTINASLAGSHISISGVTNLPDGARVLIGAWRAFRQLHGDVRVANFGGRGASFTTVVRGGHFSGTIPVVEDTLTWFFDPRTDPEGTVAAVDPEATACARFMTGRDVITNGRWSQPDPTVRAEVGNFGEHLRGSPHLHVFGSLTKYPSLYLEVSARTPVPTSAILEKIGNVQSQASAIKPLAGFCAF